MTGKTHSTKTRKIFSTNRKNKTYEEIYGYEQAIKIRQKIAIAGKKKKMSASAIEKIKIARASQVISDETKAKISATVREKVKCPYCNTLGSYRIMKRWHGNNCKHKNKNV